MSVESISATAASATAAAIDPARANASRIDPSRLRIAGSIKQAASNTGASFEYLLATA
jgi:hypothetical protein